MSDIDEHGNIVFYSFINCFNYSHKLPPGREFDLVISHCHVFSIQIRDLDILKAPTAIAPMQAS